LRYVDVASKAFTEMRQDKVGEIESYDWSPDSQWIAWGQPEENDSRRSISIPSRARNQSGDR
jgi:tricorn protease-like protein